MPRNNELELENSGLGGLTHQNVRKERGRRQREPARPSSRRDARAARASCSDLGRPCGRIDPTGQLANPGTGPRDSAPRNDRAEAQPHVHEKTRKDDRSSSISSSETGRRQTSVHGGSARSATVAQGTITRRRQLSTAGGGLTPARRPHT